MVLIKLVPIKIKNLLLNFTGKWSDSTINILDVAVSIENGVIETDLYVKPTDNRWFLLCSSTFTFQCKKGILHSQALRLIVTILQTTTLIKGVTSCKGAFWTRVTTIN